MDRVKLWKGKRYTFEMRNTSYGKCSQILRNQHHDFNLYYRGNGTVCNQIAKLEYKYRNRYIPICDACFEELIKRSNAVAK